MNAIRVSIIISVVAMILTMLSCTPKGGGLKVTEIRSKDSPLITFRIVLRSGSINDPKGKEGLNALTASMIAEGGTKELSYSEVVEKLYPWAAEIGVTADQEITTFIGEVHRDHLDAFYKLFSELILNPRFDPADFQRLKDQSLNYLENTLRSTDDENLGKQALYTFMFEGHPYGKTEVGTVEGLKAITLDDVKQYYRSSYTQANLWVGIAGGYPETLVPRIRQDFQELPGGSFVEVVLGKPQPIKDAEVLIVEKPTRAYAVSMGYPIDLTRKDKDYYALLVANSYFGEHRTSTGVLMNHLRGERGLNYGDYSYIEKFVGGTGSGSVFPDLNTPLRAQYFSIWLRPVQPENVHFAIREALWELKNLVENGLSQENFEQTRKFVTNYSKLFAASMSRRLGYQMDSEFYGTDYYIDRIEQELKSLTVSDVNAAIRKYLRSGDIRIAVVVDEGRGKDLLDAMAQNRPSPIKYSSPVPKNVLDEDKLIEAFPLAVNKEASKVISSKDLFER